MPSAAFTNWHCPLSPIRDGSAYKALAGAGAGKTHRQSGRSLGLLWTRGFREEEGDTVRVEDSVGGGGWRSDEETLDLLLPQAAAP